MSQANTGVPLNAQVNLLMIWRGMTLPSLSLRWPDSIEWLISVLMVITSPAAADLGTFTRGLGVAIVFFIVGRSGPDEPPTPPMVTLALFFSMTTKPSLTFAPPTTLR